MQKDDSENRSDDSEQYRINFIPKFHDQGSGIQNQ